MAEGVTVGAAAKVAVDLTNVALTHNTDIVNIAPLYIEAVDCVLGVMEDRTDKPFQAADSIQRNFPGSTVEQAAPAPQAPAQPAQNVISAPGAQTNVVPFPQQQAAPQAPGPFGAVAAPAAVPGQAQGSNDEFVEQAWRQFFADVQNGVVADNWYDNRTNKKSAKAPDFKHKTWKQNPSDKYGVSLWVSGKENPAWVAQSLQQFGLA